MKIKCIDNKRISLPEEISKNFSTGEILPIEIGNFYNVYAITEFYDNVWYCICYTDFPMWMPSIFFEIIDPRLSRHWIFANKNLQIQNSFFIGFPEWAIEEEFYRKLEEGFIRENQIFDGYWNLINLEFPDNTISAKAQIGDEKWLICPDCLDAWESANEKDAMVICPKCKKMFHNPRYKDQLFNHD